jgi:hypothetical protein
MAAPATSNYRRCAMNWMFESRSKDYYYDDDTEGGRLPTIKWYEFLLFPFLMIPLAFIFTIFEVLSSLADFTYAFYEIAKNVSESGKLEYPKLVITGIGIAIILPYLTSNNLFEVSDHPIITFCALIFVIFCTVAPLTGLVWLLFKKSEHLSNNHDKQGA